MSAKAVSEYSGKELIYNFFKDNSSVVKPCAVSLNEESDFDIAIQNCEWIKRDGVSILKSFYCVNAIKLNNIYYKKIYGLILG